ncbi:MAG: hypothetical protein KJZ47_00415 [Gemmatimonadales bacterium]|nr:hypothetical protein [Gemmatimonadales bacterium]
MTHLTMEQLVALREPHAEPGSHAAREHLEACPACRAELDRLHQRVARLRALPTLRPARDRFASVRAQLVAERRRRQVRWGGLGGLALAASVALFLVVRPAADSRNAAEAALSNELIETITRSQQLERALVAIEPENRVLDSRTAAITGRLEDRLQLVDRDLQAAGLMNPEVRLREQLRLWRERVGLLDALVDVHVTRASYAGL